MKRILLIVLCLSMLILSACSALANEPPAKEPTEPEDHSVAKVTYIYEYKSELVAYERVEKDHWWNFKEIYLDASETDGFHTKIEEKPWSPDMLPDIEPNSTVEIIETVTYSRIKASPAVSDFLDSGDESKKDFVLLFIGAKIRYFDGYHSVMTGERRNEWLEQSCALFYVDGDVIGNTGHILWRERDADQIIALNKWLDAVSTINPSDRPYATYGWDFSTEGILVCFPEEIEALYGFTLEQADILCERGYIDEWCTATVENSPLYGMTPTEIAAYLAAHPELLEENA